MSRLTSVVSNYQTIINSLKKEITGLEMQIELHKKNNRDLALKLSEVQESSSFWYEKWNETQVREGEIHG